MAGPKNVKPKAAKDRSTFSKKAGLHLSVGRLARLMKHGRYAPRVGLLAPLYTAAVIEYLLSEVLELSNTYNKEHKKTRVTPRSIFVSVKDDPELEHLLRDCIILEGGAKEHIDEFLLKKKSARKGASQKEASQAA